MVPPAAAHFEHAAREALSNKSAFPGEGNGRVIVRLNVHLQAVQLQFSKAVFEHQTHPFMHQSLAGMRRECVITQRRALKGPADDIVDINDTNNVTRFTMDNQEPIMTIRVKAAEIVSESLRCSRLRSDPEAMQAAAATNGGDKCRAVIWFWRPDDDSFVCASLHAGQDSRLYRGGHQTSEYLILSSERSRRRS
jgi:hypothetical protein